MAVRVPVKAQRVGVGAQAWVALGEAPCCRVVVPGPQVVAASLGIEVLAGLALVRDESVFVTSDRRCSQSDQAKSSQAHPKPD